MSLDRPEIIRATRAVAVFVSAVVYLVVLAAFAEALLQYEWGLAALLLLLIGLGGPAYHGAGQIGRSLCV